MSIFLALMQLRTSFPKFGTCGPSHFAFPRSRSLLRVGRQSARRSPRVPAPLHGSFFRSATYLPTYLPTQSIVMKKMCLSANNLNLWCVAWGLSEEHSQATVIRQGDSPCCYYLLIPMSVIMIDARKRFFETSEPPWVRWDGLLQGMGVWFSGC